MFKYGAPANFKEPPRHLRAVMGLDVYISRPETEGDELWFSAGKSKIIIVRYLSNCRIFHAKSLAERAQQINDRIADSYKKMQTSVVSLSVGLVLNTICMLLIIKTSSILAGILSLFFMLTASPFAYLILSLYDYHYEYMVLGDFVTISTLFIFTNAIIVILQIMERNEQILRRWYFGE